jgi:RNA polymerase sigma-70 factor (ECF subfamily)
LYGIAGNLTRQHARTEQRRLRAYARAAPGHTGPDASDGVIERLDAAAAVRRAAAALAELPAEQREVVLLAAWADLDCAGIARALGVPPATVRSRLHRARQRLRRQLAWAVVDEQADLDPIKALEDPA